MTEDVLFDLAEVEASSPATGADVGQIRARLRRMFSDWSETTFATYWKAYQRLALLSDLGAADSKAVTAQAIRRNGSFNVAKFDRITDELMAMWIAEQELATDQAADG